MKSSEPVPLEKLLKASQGSIYKLAVLVAKRAFQLADGDKALIDKPGDKPLENALKEIEEEKIEVAKKQQG